MAFAFFERLRGNRRPAPTQTIGVGGTVVIGGWIQETETNALVRGRQRYRTYSNLLANVSIVAAGCRYFLNLISHATWTVEPADESAEAEEIAELLEAVLYDMETPWARVVRRMAMYRYYGFSVSEWTAKRREDGAIGFLDVEPRPQSTIERWDVDEHGRVEGMTQRRPKDQAEIYLPRQKVVYVVDDSLSDSPEGLGLFRHLVEPSQRLQRYQMLEAFGFETDLRGIPKIFAPIGELNRLVKQQALTAKEKADILEPLEKFAENHIKSPELSVLLDSATYLGNDENATPSSVRQYDVELLQGSASGGLDAMARAIERINREMARIMGVEGLLLGGEKVGSQALSTDKSHNFYLIVDSSLNEIQEAVEKDLVEPFMRLNGFDPALQPEATPQKVSFQDIEQVTGALESMARSGATLAPDDPVINVVRSLMNLPDQPELDLAIDASGRGRGAPEPPGIDDPLEDDDPPDDDVPDPPAGDD